jgi:hypothetical protein
MYLSGSEFITKIKELNTTNEAKTVFINLLKKLAGCRIYLSSNAQTPDERTAYILNLLQTKTRAEAVKIVKSRYGVSAQTAYNWVNAAINSRLKA